ncbi:MAG: hypothetical protein JWL69_3249 [Phycisphaerales bacterium]|nr:hypothetical protein [Phycisphaerales bacterium]
MSQVDSVAGETPAVATAVSVSASPAPVQFPGLSHEQELVIQELVGGQSDREAARRAGVSHMTIYRWRKQNPEFAAALNAWRAQAQESARDRVLGLAHLATQALQQALEKGDSRAALALLKSIGALNPPAPGPESADQAGLAAKLDEIEGLTQLARRNIHARCANHQVRNDEKMYLDDAGYYLNRK